MWKEMGCLPMCYKITHWKKFHVLPNLKSSGTQPIFIVKLYPLVQEVACHRYKSDSFISYELPLSVFHITDTTVGGDIWYRSLGHMLTLLFAVWFSVLPYSTWGWPGTTSWSKVPNILSCMLCVVISVFFLRDRGFLKS